MSTDHILRTSVEKDGWTNELMAGGECEVKRGFFKPGDVCRNGPEAMRDGRNLFCFELDFLSFGILKMTPLVAQW